MAPVTTLRTIVQLILKQYGSRFQVTVPQIVRFINEIQYIALNQDFCSRIEYDQTFFLGQDCFLETDSITYTAPDFSDLGKIVEGSTLGSIGKLMNFQTENRINKWIIEPPDGGPNFVIPNFEVLTIPTGSPATGLVCKNQEYKVSSGPYHPPDVLDPTAPPYRKLDMITLVTDRQLFGLPPNSSFDGLDDYGLFLNRRPGSRNLGLAYRKNDETNEVTLQLSVPPEIKQTEETCGPGGTTLNTSDLRWFYWKNPPAIEDIDDEDKVILPQEYRYEILYEGASLMADRATFGNKGSIRQLIDQGLFERFWEDKRVQYQAYGSSVSDWISEGDPFYMHSNRTGYFGQTARGNRLL